jgi:hypothetical protein
LQADKLAEGDRKSNKPLVDLREKAYTPDADPRALFGAVSAHLAGIPLLMLLYPEPLDALVRDPESIDVGENATIDDRNYHTLLFNNADGADWRLVCDAETKLFRRIEVEWAGRGLAALKLQDSGVQSVRFSWEAGEVTTDPVKAEETFRRRIGAGRKGFENFEQIPMEPLTPLGEMFVPVPPGDGTFVDIVVALIDWFKGD